MGMSAHHALTVLASPGGGEAVSQAQSVAVSRSGPVVARGAAVATLLKQTQPYHSGTIYSTARLSLATQAELGDPLQQAQATRGRRRGRRAVAALQSSQLHGCSMHEQSPMSGRAETGQSAEAQARPQSRQQAAARRAAARHALGGRGSPDGERQSVAMCGCSAECKWRNGTGRAMVEATAASASRRSAAHGAGTGAPMNVGVPVRYGMRASGCEPSERGKRKQEREAPASITSELTSVTAPGSAAGA